MADLIEIDAGVYLEIIVVALLVMIVIYIRRAERLLVRIEYLLREEEKK